MKRLPRTYFGNPILRTKGRRLTAQEIARPALQALIRRMFFTMRRVGGVGLAAPQIGKSIQLAVIEIDQTGLRPSVTPLPPLVIINPVILRCSADEVMDWEGCLSFPGARGLVPRSRRIEVAYLDEHGNKQTVQLRGFQARVFQHEIDHLNGRLYIDRMADMTTLMTMREFGKRILSHGALKSK